MIDLADYDYALPPSAIAQQPLAERDGAKLLRVDRATGARGHGAIRDLPEAYRETLVLRLVEGMSGDEIAARTGLTSASVRVNLHRGIKMLRERLGSR